MPHKRSKLAIDKLESLFCIFCQFFVDLFVVFLPVFKWHLLSHILVKTLFRMVLSRKFTSHNVFHYIMKPIQNHILWFLEFALYSININFNICIFCTPFHIFEHVIPIRPDLVLEIPHFAFKRYCPIHWEEISFNFLIVYLNEVSNYFNLAEDTVAVKTEG